MCSTHIWGCPQIGETSLPTKGEGSDEKAALAAYDQFIEGWGSHDGFGPTAEVVGDVADYVVDAEGNEAPEIPPKVCVCCGDTDNLEMVPVDVPTNYQPVCEGCVENYRKNCEPGE